MHFGGGGNYVNYLGKKYGDEKSEILASSDIFVFPTCYPNECFPLVLLEAMQHGLPMVTTDKGGITDVVLDGVNEFICRKHDSKDLANNIGFLLDNPQVAFDMGWKGKNLYEERFTLRICLTCITGALDKAVVSV